MSTPKRSKLRRPIHQMPDFVTEALEQHGLTEAYSQRPAYQQNDYVGWILRAKRPATRQERLVRMLDELRRGGVYMGMDHPPSRRP